MALKMLSIKKNQILMITYKLMMMKKRDFLENLVLA